ncbi:hypothetical protein PInf_022004 [Phytophthora infestans]|nr:hypothetical protein PInf_022004 [Phytophthora infestans]
MFSSAPTSNTSPSAIGSGIERRPPAFIHPGGGRDYHSMHYVESFKDEERTREGEVLKRKEELLMQEFGSLFLYDVMHSRWDSLANATLGDRPTCRINHSLTFAAPNHLVLFGGRRRAVRQNELFIYNVNSQPAEPNAVQKLLIFGGYAGAHQWLDDLYLLSLPQTVLMQAPTTSRSSSQSIAATQRTRPTRSSFKQPVARVAFSAPQQPIQTRQSSQTALLQGESIQSEPLVQEPPTSEQQQQTQTVEPENEPTQENSEQSQALQQSSVALDTPLSSPPRQAEPPGPITTTVTASGSGVLTDITNQGAGLETQQQEPAVSSGVANPRVGASSSGALKKNKRRRLADDSQESSNSNSNSSNGSGELTNAQVGIQTMLLQLLQHQPRMEDALARITSMLTREQTARQQQSLNQETVMRVHSEEQSKRLEAANRRNEALEGQLARAEAERASLHEKLMARETELYMHKHSLEAAIPPLSERVQAIEASHIQQLNVSRVIESKISAVHDFMDELRNAGGEGTEADDSPQRHLGRLDDSVASQPTPSPPKPLLYPQRVVLALEEKIRVMQSEKNAREAQFKEMAEKLKKVEAREVQARQFLFSWCQQEDNPAPLMSVETASAARPETAKTDPDNTVDS